MRRTGVESQRVLKSEETGGEVRHKTMSLSPQQAAELHDLVGQLCNDDLRRDAFERLVALLDGNREAQQVYVRYLDMHQSLRELAVGLDQRQALSDIQAVLSDLAKLDDCVITPHLVRESSAADHDDPQAPGTVGRNGQLGEKARESSHPPAPLPVPFGENHPLVDPSRSSQVLGFLASGTFAWSLFSLLLIVVVASLWLVKSSSSPSEAPLANKLVAVGSEEHAESSSKTTSAVASSTYVARVINASSDLEWGDLSTFGEFLLRVRVGDRIHLAAGLVELEFHSGARIILHGPAVFMPTGPAAGHLESGRLTGKVDNGNFRLTTPAAEVIDLGTEFGVLADDKMGSDVVVFDGRVQVVSRSDGAGAEKVLDMIEGMAARFHFDGTTEYGLQTDAAQFKRSIASRSTPARENEICLIDVLAGGDGLGVRLAGAIDPLTGRKDYGQGQPVAIGPRMSDGAFHSCSWQPLIDGVFIPTADGQQVQLDSLGRKVNLPSGHGRTWACIWSRSKQSVDKLKSSPDCDFWGARTLGGIVERLKQVHNGLIGIHANVGITFDLQAVRLLHRRSPIEFRGGVVNLEASAEFPPEEVIIEKRTADLRVLVDGKLRYSRLGFCREDGDVQFAVPLAPNDRFLTVISSDDGNYSWDQVMLIDPVIVLPEPPPRSVEARR
jgi:hypothetical protein